MRSTFEPAARQPRREMNPASRSLRLAVLLIASIATVAYAYGVEVVDDAGRQVDIPAKVARVFAAGHPAEILVYTLAPEMLVGRNHPPPAAALELIPPEYRKLPTISSLPEL